jgi:hypothetical protein
MIEMFLKNKLLDKKNKILKTKATVKYVKRKQVD